MESKVVGVKTEYGKELSPTQSKPRILTNISRDFKSMFHVLSPIFTNIFFGCQDVKW